MKIAAAAHNEERRMRQTRERGLTLIELLMVVAIVGILAAVAMPMYQDYAKRAKLTEVVLAASACRTPVSDVYQQSGATTVSAGLFGCNVSAVASRYVKTISTDDKGAITVVALGFGDADIDNRAIVMTPYHDNATVKNPATAGHLGQPVFKWVCGPTPTSGIPAHLLPNSCRGS